MKEVNQHASYQLFVYLCTSVWWLSTAARWFFPLFAFSPRRFFLFSALCRGACYLECTQVPRCFGLPAPLQPDTACAAANRSHPHTPTHPSVRRFAECTVASPGMRGGACLATGCCLRRLGRCVQLLSSDGFAPTHPTPALARHGVMIEGAMMA